MSSIFYVKPTIDDDIEENESAHPAKENNFENLSEMNNVDKASTKDSVLDNSDPNSSEEKQENVLQEKKQLPVVEESQQESQPPTAIIATSDNSMNKNPTSVETQSSDSVQKTRQKFNQASNLGNATGFPPFVKSSNKKANVEDAYDSLNVASIVLDINEKSWYIRSAQGDMVQMRRLLDKDEDLAEKKDFIMNGIHWAAKKGNLDMLKMMLDHNNEVNLRTHGGYTPLHLAAMYGHEECISLLLDYGADVNVRDYSGKKPISYLKVYSENDNETQARLPSWQRHYHSGSKHMSVISDDVYDRIEVKMITSKLDNEVVRRRRSENNMGINGKQRAKSEVFIEPKNGESGVKSGKPVRRGSSKGLWKMPSIRRSKTPSLSSIEHNVPMTTGYGKPSTPTSGAMWKPAGPKA